MNFDFCLQINPYLEKLDFKSALAVAETNLQAIPKSAFHAILGKSLVSQADNLAVWVDKFYKNAAKKNAPAALYFEMNEFDINVDQ